MLSYLSINLKNIFQSLTTQKIEGTYRKRVEVIHYFDNEKNLNVVVNATNNQFISGWNLHKTQRDNL